MQPPAGGWHLGRRHVWRMDSPIPGLKLPSRQSKAAHIDMAGIAESKHRCTWNPRLCARLSLIVEASFRHDS